MKTWGKLLNAMADNIDHKDDDVKRAAIMTLGYICEEFSKD